MTTMQSYEVNKVGITIGRPSSKQRTYIFAGIERGGTTPVAGVARALGLYMGEGLHRNNEDPLFVHTGLHATIKAIEERNSTHSVWGWKFPKAFLTLPLYFEYLRNPHLILVFRDPIASAMGHSKWSGEGIRKPIRFHISEAQAFNSLNVTHSMVAGVPAFLISYERWLFNIEDGIEELARFLDLDLPAMDMKSKIINYLDGNTYKDFDAFFSS